MAHFITLFFLSIGLNINGPQSPELTKLQSENFRSTTNLSYDQIKKPSNSTKTIVFEHNNNYGKIEKIGNKGWDRIVNP